MGLGHYRLLSESQDRWESGERLLLVLLVLESGKWYFVKPALGNQQCNLKA